jgi:hypothetical protein
MRSGSQSLLLEGSAIALLAGIAMVIGLQYSELPPQLPIHFGLAGTSDSYGPKSTLWILFAIAIFTYLVLSAAQRNPDLLNIPIAVDRSHPAVRQSLTESTVILKIWILAMFLSLTWDICKIGLGAAVDLSLRTKLLLFALIPVAFFGFWWRLRSIHAD